MNIDWGTVAKNSDQTTEAVYQYNRLHFGCDVKVIINCMGLETSEQGFHLGIILSFNFKVWVKPWQIDRSIAQAVSNRLPTAAARVRAWIRSCRIYGGRSGIGASFLQVFRIPLLIISTTAKHSSTSIILGWYNRTNGGRHTKWTQSRHTPRN
jgi:hypothetical protein